MTSKNDITGDNLATKPATDAYRDNWERIFGARKLTNIPINVVHKLGGNAPLQEKEGLREKLRSETSGITSFHTGVSADRTRLGDDEETE